jgi:hypothetical protein
MRDRMYRKFAGMTSAPEVQQFFEAALEMEEAKEKDYARRKDERKNKKAAVTVFFPTSAEKKLTGFF